MIYLSIKAEQTTEKTPEFSAFDVFQKVCCKKKIKNIFYNICWSSCSKSLSSLNEYSVSVVHASLVQLVVVALVGVTSPVLRRILALVMVVHCSHELDSPTRTWSLSSSTPRVS